MEGYNSIYGIQLLLNMTNNKVVRVCLEIHGNEATYLTDSKEKSARSMKSEATLRLLDHIKRFEMITEIGSCQERKSDEEKTCRGAAATNANG
jgi:hypothetical protein